MHHTFKDTKEAFIRAVSLKLGEYAQDVRKAVQDELPHVFTIPARGQAIEHGKIALFSHEGRITTVHLEYKSILDYKLDYMINGD